MIWPYSLLGEGVEWAMSCIVRYQRVIWSLCLNLDISWHGCTSFEKSPPHIVECCHTSMCKTAGVETRSWFGTGGVGIRSNLCLQSRLKTENQIRKKFCLTRWPGQSKHNHWHQHILLFWLPLLVEVSRAGAFTWFSYLERTKAPDQEELTIGGFS